MTSLLKADIFFFITTIAVIILIIISIVIGYVLFKLVRHAEYIARKIREESDNISEDIALVRAGIKDRVQEGIHIGGILSFLGNLFRSKGKKTSASHSKTRKVRKVEVSDTDL